MPKTGRLEIRINGTLRDEPAKVLLELKRRGLCRSNMDGIGQGLLIFWERILIRDEKTARLRALSEVEQKDDV